VNTQTFEKTEGIQRFVHQKDSRKQDGGTRKMIKNKVSMLLNQNLQKCLKSTKKLVTKLDPELQEKVTGEI
jgi:hypothetical protein